MPNDPRDTDDDLTPTHGVPAPLSETAINLLQVAADTNALARSLEQAARQHDRLEGLARRALCADLAAYFDRIIADYENLRAALTEEALKTE